MKKRSLVRTDYVSRMHLYVDVEASKFDAFAVELLDSRLVVHDARLTLDDLWREALRAVAWMRTQPFERLYPVHVFDPFVLVTAVDSSRESTKLALRNNLIVGHVYADQAWPPPQDDPASHEGRVRALCAALDGIELLRRTAGGVH
jgi:hypothetical protein